MLRIVGLIAFVLMAWVGPARSEELIVFADEHYPPVVFVRSGQPQGLLPTVLRRAEAMTGDRYVLRLMPWRRAYELALRGEGGLIGISYNSERAALFDYSRPIYEDNVQVVTLSDRTFPFQNVDDLRGKTVGGVSGASYGENVDRAIASGVFKVERDVSQTGRLRMLLAGRLDAALIGNGAAGLAQVINSSPDLAAKAGRFVALPTPLVRDPLHLAFSKSMNKTAALQRFNQAVERMRASGELARITSQGGS